MAILVATILVAASCTGDPANDENATGTTVTGDTEDSGDEDPAEPATPTEVRGLTDDTITIAFIGADFGALAEQGLAPDLGDQPAVMQALVDHMNDNGGIAGRQIDLRVHIIEGLAGPEAGRTACLRATEEDEAFAVIIANAVGRDTTRCVAVQNQTLTLAGTGWDDELYGEAEGRLLSLGSHITMGTNRNYAGWAQVLDDEGMLDDRTIGVVVSDTPELVPAASGSLVPALEDLGHEVAEYIVLPCPEGVTGCEQHDTAVQRLQNADVDFVFMSANILAGVQLVTAAQNAGYSPEWTANRDQLTDTVAQFFASVADEWDGTIGMSTLWPLEDHVTDEAVECNQIVAERGGPDVEYELGDAFAFTAVNCILLQTLAEAIESVDEVSPDSVYDSLADWGEVPVNAGPDASLEPGKPDAGDYVFLAQYSAEAGVFVPYDETPRRID